MSYVNAGKGIKKLFLAQIFAIIATLFSSGVTLLVSIISRLIALEDTTDVVSLMVAGAICGFIFIVATTAMAIFSFLGCFQASKDEPEFRKAMICTITLGALSLISFFFQIPNGTVSVVFNSASIIFELFAMVFTVSGLINLAGSCERPDMVGKGDRVLKLLTVTYIIYAICTLIIRIFELSEQAKMVSVIVGAVSLLLNVFQFILYMRYLYRSILMLRNN